jgi:protein AbiQ
LDKIKFYEIDADYIIYLQKTDAKVPRIEYSETSAHDKFLYGVILRVNGHEYFAPISSNSKKFRTTFQILNEQGNPLSAIRFSFMIPVPPGAYHYKDISKEPDARYRALLIREYVYCKKHSNAVFRTARYVYNSVTLKKDPLMIKNCCDFKALEAACAEYAKRRLAEQADPNDTER